MRRPADLCRQPISTDRNEHDNVEIPIASDGKEFAVRSNGGDWLIAWLYPTVVRELSVCWYGIGYRRTESSLTTTFAFYLNRLFAFAQLYGYNYIRFFPLTKFITFRTTNLGHDIIQINHNVSDSMNVHELSVGQDDNGYRPAESSRASSNGSQTRNWSWSVCLKEMCGVLFILIRESLLKESRHMRIRLCRSMAIFISSTVVISSRVRSWSLLIQGMILLYTASTPCRSIWRETERYISKR